MSMKFSLESREKIVHHWMLQDAETALKIGETDDWKINKTLTAKVTVNGVELDFDILENYFMDIYQSMDGRIRESYNDQEQEVQRRLEERMEKEAKPILDKMYELQQVLEDSGNIIKPYWEKLTK